MRALVFGRGGPMAASRAYLRTGMKLFVWVLCLLVCLFVCLFACLFCLFDRESLGQGKFASGELKFAQGELKLARGDLRFWREGGGRMGPK